MKGKIIAIGFIILAVFLYIFAIVEFSKRNTAEGVKVTLFALTDSRMAYCFTEL